MRCAQYRVPKSPGGRNQTGVEADQDKGPTQSEFEVCRVVSAQAVRGGQSVEAHEVGCLLVQAHWQFAQLSSHFRSPGGLEWLPAAFDAG